MYVAAVSVLIGFEAAVAVSIHVVAVSVLIDSKRRYRYTVSQTSCKLEHATLLGARVQCKTCLSTKRL